MCPGIFLWPMWPTLSPSLLASKGFFKLNFFSPPGSHSMSQGGSSSGNPGVVPIKMVGVLSCAASMPACSIFHSACFGLCLPLDGLSCGSRSCLRMPTLRTSHSSDSGSPESFCDGGSSGLSLHHASPSALGSNALGSVVVCYRLSKRPNRFHGTCSGLGT